MKLEDKVELWRSRFYGRQDMFAEKVAIYSVKDKTMRRTYTPVYREKYRSKDMRNGKTFEEVSELYLPLQNKDVAGHINGDRELMVYVLQVDRTIRFAAVDFDTQYDFNDVLKCYNVIKGYGVKCAIARSTKKGHHVYMFFDDFFEAKLITSFLYQVYRDAGFVLRVEMDGICLPETFPKTTRLRTNISTGYGIKPPMHGPGMKINQNCWVDENNEPIGGSGEAEEQWDFFSNIELNSSKELERILNENGIEIRDVRISERRGLVESKDYSRAVPYEPPGDGDFSLIISGCPMLADMWSRNPADVPHDARVAMITWAMQTTNGIEMLRDNWGHSSMTENQISYALDTNQNPWTCLACQDHMACKIGKHPRFATGKSKSSDGSVQADFCFRRVPPKETVNGEVVINPHKLPEEEWPDPSPVRLRKKSITVTKEDLLKEVDELDPKDDELDSKLESIAKKIVRLRNAKERKFIKDRIKERKLVKVAVLKSFLDEASEEKKNEATQRLDSDSNILLANGTRYIVLEHGGYGILDVDKDGNTICTEVSNFQIVLEKDVQIHTMINDNIRNLTGYILCQGKKTPFKIDMESWNQPSRLAMAISSSAGSNALFRNINLDRIKEAAGVFGSRTIETISKHENHGWDSMTNPSVYRCQNINITREAMESDGEHVTFEGSGFARSLNLTEINNQDFAKAVHVIKNDLVELQESFITMTTISHSLQAAIQNVFIPFREAPVLWIQGTSGAGKTTIGKIGQDFYGTFDKLITITGTVMSLEMYSMTFKDALLVIDDYKESNPKARQDMINLIQKTYDRSGRTRLKSNLEQRQEVFCRGLIMLTAEDRPSSEASVLSRCIYLEAPQLIADSLKDNESLTKVNEVRHLFSGVTARFIQYMLMNYNGEDDMKDRYDEIFKDIIDPIRGTNNSNRVAQNLGANYLTWTLFCEFLVSSGVMTEKEQVNFLARHWENIKLLRDKMVIVLGQEVASAVFLSALKEKLSSGRARIEGLTEDNDRNRNAETIGYIDNPDAKEIYLYPTTCVGMAKEAITKLGSNISHGTEAIGKQLQQTGMISRSEPSRTTLRKMWKGTRSYVWCIDAIAAEIGSFKDGSDNKVTSSPEVEDPDIDGELNLPQR